MDKEEYRRLLAARPRPLVVDFWAPWCAPCKAIEPALQKLAQTYAGQVDVLRLNADEHPDLLAALGIFGIPTLIAYRGETEIARRAGAAGVQTLEGLFLAALQGEKTALQLSTPERLTRLTAGMGLFSLGALNLVVLGGSPWVSGGLAALGLALGFSGVYDRCPVYRALSAWVKSRLQ